MINATLCRVSRGNYGIRLRWRAPFWLMLILTAFPPQAITGELSREKLTTFFPSPYIVEEKLSDIPVWPIFKEGPVPSVVGYVFESIDFAPIPGFAGTPMNLLVAIDPGGLFIDVRVLSQREPVFVGGLGEEPLLAFVEQYKGNSLLKNIRVSSMMNRGGSLSDDFVTFDGVSKATVSVKIINQSVISSALKVARAKLGFAGGRDTDQVARVRKDIFEEKNWQQLLDEGLVVHKRVLNRDIEELFANTEVAHVDDEARLNPEGLFVDLYIAPLTVPTIGRSMFDDQALAEITDYMEEDDHAILVMSSGRYSFVDEDFVRGAVPRLLSLSQGGLPIELRDLDVDVIPTLPGVPQAEAIKVFQVAAHAGLDPALPWQLALQVVRDRGQIYRERYVKEVAVSYRFADRFLIKSESGQQYEGWRAVWVERMTEILVLLLGLTVLSAALVWQHRLSSSARRLSVFRYAFLAFTLGFIGWYAQGQLSIVNITALIQAFIAGSDLSFFLYDPMSVILWGFVGLTLVAWGRGTFCGWLCPFGALQEFIGKLAQRIGIRQIKPTQQWDTRLKKLKYALLLLIVVSAALSSELVDHLVEIEPFKTAITLMFVRSWPFLLYAVALLVLGAFVYKGFCRYLCPLGAGLAVLGSIRQFDWLTRRTECGSPCQLCRRTCEYNAIAEDGAIIYRDCFQCLDCVSVYTDPKRCVAEVVIRKRGRNLSTGAVGVRAG